MYKTDPNPDYSKLRILYITGISGSGTTLLYRLLSQYFETRACISSTFELPESSPFFMKKVDSFNTLEDYLKAMLDHNEISTITYQTIYGSEYLNRLFKHKNYINLNKNIVIDTAPILHQLRAKKLREAFPKAQFILVFRNPANSIEGLRRKWKLFSECDISYLCDFWEFSHKQFIKDTSSFSKDVYWLSYERLIENTQEQLNTYAGFWNLKERPEIKKLKDDIPNSPKKGLRNVINGVIQISETSDSNDFVLSKKEVEYVKERLLPLYNQLLTYQPN